MNLIRHLGQQKLYGLVHQACLLLQAETKHDPELHKRIKLITKEARIEGYLTKHLGRWYFGLLQVCKRGFNYSGKPSHYLKFCDDKTTYTNPEPPLTKIRTTVLGGQVITAQLDYHQKVKKLKERCARFFTNHPALLHPGKEKEVTTNRQTNAEALPTKKPAKPSLLGIFKHKKSDPDRIAIPLDTVHLPG